MSASSPRVITDDDLHVWLHPVEAVECMRRATVAALEQRLCAPPRVSADLGAGRIVFTVGAMSGQWYGYRSYDTFDHSAGEQVVVAHSARTGRVRAIAIGETLGRLRTGALGGLAADILARRDASTLGLIGAGAQAWTQLWALTGVRKLDDVRVYARTEGRAAAFAARARREMGIPCEAAGSAEAAVRDRDIVVLATTSPTPVLDSRWLARGSHVTTLGPKQVDRAEFDLSLLDAADVLATDSPIQLQAYDPPALAAVSGHADRVRSLGALVAAPFRRTTDDESTVYLSVGLAGTEIALLEHVASLIDQNRR
ncbi:MAG TPA: hypothetical protein VFT75_10275 [Nocardioidaceae bacterium]|jgi:ornithine cyclodeaminase|nr:hypothetical protein [Nocardioidaceae bacterium]